VRVRPRSTASLACAFLAAALLVTGCGGGDKKESTDKPAATGTKGRVVKLDAPARDRAKPFVIRSIKRT